LLRAPRKSKKYKEVTSRPKRQQVMVPNLFKEPKKEENQLKQGRPVKALT